MVALMVLVVNNVIIELDVQVNPELVGIFCGMLATVKELKEPKLAVAEPFLAQSA